MVSARRKAATPSGVSLLLLCPRCYDVGSDVMVEQGGWVVQEYVQTIVCAGDSWKMVYPMLGLWLEADSSGSLIRRRSRAGGASACLGSCYPSLILSMAMVCPIKNYFGGPKSC